MHSSGKRVFAGKPSLYAEPFCPYLTDERGFAKLRRSFARRHQLADAPMSVRLFMNGGKSPI